MRGSGTAWRHGLPTWALLALALALSLPLPALAHGSLKGAPVFFNGLMHPFVAAAHAITLVALALWMGGQGDARRRWMLNALVAGLLVGASLAGVAQEPNTDPVLLALAVCCSLSVALQWNGPGVFAVGMGFFVGAAVGLGSGDPAFTGVPRLILLAGTFIGATVLVAQLALWVHELIARRQWRPALIAVRIVSSWMSAITMLLLALTVR